MRCRRTNGDDLPQLRELWKLGFGDTDEEIDAFFRTCWPETMGFAVEEDGRLLSALYTLPQTIASGEEMHRAAYIYALSTLPQRRGEGLAKKLIAYAARELQKRYFACMWLVPEHEELRGYYRSIGFEDGMFVNAEELDAPEGRGECARASVQDYAGLRETLLFDLPHIRYSAAQLTYQQNDWTFHTLLLDGRFGCAAARKDGDTLIVRELLPDEAMLPALTRELPCSRCEIRTAGNRTPVGRVRWLDPAERVSGVYAPFA